MKLSTPVTISAPLQLLGLRSRIAFIGSCFAENIGARVKQNGLPVLVNPFGVLYNPLSILQALAQNPQFDSLYFADDDGQWHCWLTDSSLSASSLEACKAAVLAARGRLFSWKPTTLVITLGTTHYYERDRLVVGNCHKQPQAEFTESELTLEQTISTLDSICQLFPQSQIVFTVSPYRYAKYGMHESQLAKATLLLAIEAVRKSRPIQVCYFPAYELVVDELRDYRFYAEDMLHPSQQAIEIIFERFTSAYMDAETQQFYADYEPIRKALQHRPVKPGSEAAMRFVEKTRQQVSDLMHKYNIEL